MSQLVLCGGCAGMKFDCHLRFVRFDRVPYISHSPQRFAAARRKVQKEKDVVGLFPEMAPYKDADEYVQLMDQQRISHLRNWRNQQAKDWRKVRADLRTFNPITKAGIIAYWNQSNLPADPVYLMGVIRDVRVRHNSGWRKLRELRQFRLIGLGRLPRSVAFQLAKSK